MSNTGNEAPSSTRSIILELDSPYDKSLGIKSCFHSGAPDTESERFFFLPIFIFGTDKDGNPREKAASVEFYHERYSLYNVGKKASSGEVEKIQSTAQRIAWVKKIVPPAD